MKKFFSFFAALLFAGSMMAAETVVFSEQGYENGQAIETYAGTEFTITFDKGTNNNAPKYYNTGAAIRCYGGNSFTVTSEKDITKIELAFAEGEGTNAILTDVEAYADGVWAGKAKAIKFTIDGTSGHRRIASVAVTFDGEGGDDPVLGAWAEIKFTEAVAADALAEDALFTSDVEGFQAQIADAGNKMSIDANDCRFGTAEDYDMYRFRLKSGGASGADKNFITVSVPTDGKLRTAVRTSSNSATDRELYLIQEGDTLYKGIIQESMAIEVTENEQTVKVYPFVEVPVKAGNVIVRYSGGLNFYEFGFNGTLTPEEKLTFDFKLENNILTITPSNNDPWAGMAIPTAVITEEFGTIEALVDVVKDMQGTTTGKQSLDLTKLDPEEFPAGTECTFVAYGLVEGAVTTVASFEFVVPAPLADPTNCAEAAEAALSVEKNGDLYNGGKEYTIEGYVTEIATAYSDQYHNISFWMADEKDGGQVLQAFRAACASAEDAPGVGDKVKVTGKLTKYNTTPEFAAGCTFVITEKAEPVDENEVVKLGFNLPTENRPADNSIEIAGSFVEGTMALEKVEATGWFLSYDFVKAVADDTFKLRDKSNNDLILCKYNEGKAIWEQAIFTFGDYWQDDTWKGTPCKLIEEDLSNAAEYAWKEGAPEPSEELADPTNCAEAAEAALSVSENNELYNDGKIYTIEGYVTEIATAYSDQYHNITFWMADEKDGGKVLEAFRAACASAEDAARVGDKVKVTGALTKYNTTPEFAAGCTYEIIERGEQPDPQNLGEKTIAEFLELKNKIDTCILTGAIDSVVNTLYGNFNLVDATGKVYVYGLLTAAGESKKCFEEEGLQEGDVITVLAIYNEYNGKPQVKDAIFVRKKGQGIDNTNVEIKVEKFFRDGQLIIRKNGIEYNVQGAVIK